MAFGLEFINNSNVVTLDSEYARLCVICSGRYLPNQEGGLGSVTAFPVVITTQEPPLVFCRPDTVASGYASIVLARIVGSPGNWTGFYVRAWNVNSAQPNGRWFAGAFQAKALAQFGLRLFGASSELLFDSDTPSAVFTRAFQNWTYRRTETLDIGSANIYTVPTTFPEDEYLLINSFSMNMAAANTPGRMLGSRWVFSAGELQATTTGTSNPFAFYLPAVFAKMTA
jgi:hypothetical protein